jgi:hypothetical protein
MADIILTEAYYEQFHKIGWFHFLLSQLSLKLAKAVSAYQHNSDNGQPNYSSSQLIGLLWVFTKNMWLHRNQIVHGASIEEAAQKWLQPLQDKTRYHYEQFAQNSSYVLPRQDYLFLQRTLHQLETSYDHLQCWLWSVDKALSIIIFQDAHLREMSRQVYSLLNFALPNTSDDSSYAPSITSSMDSMQTFTLPATI